MVVIGFLLLRGNTPLDDTDALLTTKLRRLRRVADPTASTTETSEFGREGSG